MKLFLSGGGSGEDSLNLDKRFIESIDKTKPVLYIPIAMDSNKHPYPECLGWLKGNFSNFNFDNFVMWTEEDLKNKREEDFKHFSGIYIGGGNTFKLLDDLKKFGTFEILQTLAHKDIPIYGGSAGAIILTRSILSASYFDTNAIDLKYFSALNMTHGFDIWCHYNTSMKEDIITFIDQYNLNKTLALPENSGLYVTEECVEIIGPGEVMLFEKGEEKVIYKDGDIIHV
jgi:dipeptidase E